jgi:hypothetical protein
MSPCCRPQAERDERRNPRHCRSGNGEPPVNRRPAAAVRVLQAVLAAEHAAVYGYGVAGAHLSGGRLATARTDWVAHQVARDRLEQMISSLGAEPVAAAPAYQLPVPVHNASGAARLAALLEDRLATAYLGMVALSEPALRRYGAGQVGAAAMRAAYWRGSTVAFPGLPARALARSRRAR